MNFKFWLIEDLISEAVIRFGQKFMDKHVDVVPGDMWQWVLTKMKESPSWTPRIEGDDGKFLTKQQVLDLATRRAGNYTTPQSPQPRPQQKYAEAPRLWTLATVLNVPPLKQGEKVVLSKGPAGNWKILTKDKQEIVIDPQQSQNIASMVRSEKGSDGKPIQGMNPDELLGKSDKPQDLADPNQEVKGRIPAARMSHYQTAIQETFMKSNQSITIDALAGCGKTTMLKHLASFKKPNEKWLYLVFGKKNQIESAHEFPKGVEVKTSHAYLGDLLRRNAGKKIIQNTELPGKGQGSKIGIICDEMFEYDTIFPRPIKYGAKRSTLRLAELAKNFAVDPTNERAAATKMKEIISRYQIDTDLSTEKYDSDRDWTDQIVSYGIQLLQKSLPGRSGMSSLDNIRDHDDTLWYAALDPRIVWDKFDVVLADEVQDFNRNQIIMLQKLKERGARIISVGDKNQSIYGFRGADANAFDEVQKITSGNLESKKLPVNYRSCKEIINYVNKTTHVNNLQAGLDCEGAVQEGVDSNAMELVSNEWMKGNKLSMETAFIARMNKPLVAKALELMQNQIDFEIVGKDLSKELVDFIGKIIGRGKYARHEPIEDFAGPNGSMFDFLGRMEEKWGHKIAKAAELEEMTQIAESLTGIYRFLEMRQFRDERVKMEVRTTEDFINYIKKKFSGTDEEQGKNQNRDPRSFVTLSTAHKSKGLEYERVFILSNNLFPHPKAVKSQNPEELAQEDNLKYVAYTRAKKHLYVLEGEEEE